MADPDGRIIELSEGRMVFLAEHPTQPDTFCVAFKNEHGDDTYLKISTEALDALLELRLDRQAGLPPRAYPHRKDVGEWRVVSTAVIRAEAQS
jgi:hypothetical protein